MQIKTIGLIGKGTMGQGIAHVATLSGYTVIVRDIDCDKTKKGVAQVEKTWSRLVEKGKLEAAKVEESKSRLKPAQSLTDLKDCDLIIEAVTEDVAIKTDLFKELNTIVKSDAIFATNTSSISVTQLAAASGRPSQFVGMHFFNPVPMMKLVEIIRGLQTSDDTFNTVFEVSKTLGKVPAAIKDSAGFAVNRLLLPMINEAFYLLQEGVADAPTIDEVMKLGANHPMGPLTLGDFVGLDVTLAAMEVLHRDFGDSKYRPCPLLRKYVESGWLGRKTGRGVYNYTEQK